MLYYEIKTTKPKLCSNCVKNDPCDVIKMREMRGSWIIFDTIIRQFGLCRSKLDFLVPRSLRNGLKKMVLIL